MFLPKSRVHIIAKFYPNHGFILSQSFYPNHGFISKRKFIKHNTQKYLTLLLNLTQKITKRYQASRLKWRICKNENVKLKTKAESHTIKGLQSNALQAFLFYSTMSFFVVWLPLCHFLWFF